MEYNELVVRIRDMSDKDIYVLRNELKMEISKIEDAYTDEIASFATANFDPNSYWGARKIKKVANKYAEMSDGPSFILELVEEEISKREYLNEQKRYSGKGSGYTKKDVDSFLESEKLKTMAHQFDLKDNGYDQIQEDEIDEDDEDDDGEETDEE